MKKLEELSYAKDLFGFLAQEDRLRMGNILSKVDEISVNDLSELVGITQSMCSRALKSLRDQRLIKYRRDAQNNYYYLEPEVKELFTLLLLPFQHLQEIQVDNQKVKKLS